MKKVCVIPVKENSDRVQSKNFRNFFEDESLLSIKIKQVLDSNVFDTVYISSDAQEARQLAAKLGVTYIKRDKEFCNNVTSWSDVITNVISSLPEENALVCWTHTTSPLFSNFSDLIKTYETKQELGYNGVITVKSLNEFILNENSTPNNYSWGVWHPYSQDLKKLYAVNGAAFVTTKREMLKNNYVISRKPFMYLCSDQESIDIDTEQDFLLAQTFYKINKGYTLEKKLS